MHSTKAPLIPNWDLDESTKDQRKAEYSKREGMTTEEKWTAGNQFSEYSYSGEAHPSALQRRCLPGGKGGSMRRKRVRQEQEEEAGCKICQVSKRRSRGNLGENKSQISGMMFCLITLRTLCISNTKGAA